MKNESEYSRLLKDVMDEGGYAEFREKLYRRGLGELHRRRWKGFRFERALALAACIAVLAVLGAFFAHKGRQPGTTSSVDLLRSTPLSGEQLIRDIPGSVERISTEPLSLTYIADKQSPELIGEDFKSPVTVLPDDELLELFRGHSTALVTIGPASKQLIFLDPQDNSAFWGTTEEVLH